MARMWKDAYYEAQEAARRLKAKNEQAQRAKPYEDAKVRKENESMHRMSKGIAATQPR